MMLVDFILQILAGFHQATHRENVVIAFGQAGICSRSTGPDPYMVLREAFLDRARARAVVDQLGLYEDRERVPELPGEQIRISTLNSELGRALEERGRRATQGQTVKGSLLQRLQSAHGAIAAPPSADRGAIDVPQIAHGAFIVPRADRGAYAVHTPASEATRSLLRPAPTAARLPPTRRATKARSCPLLLLFNLLWLIFIIKLIVSFLKFSCFYPFILFLLHTPSHNATRASCGKINKFVFST